MQEAVIVAFILVASVFCAPNAEIQCKNSCKMPPSKNGKNVKGSFKVHFSDDECMATYTCTGTATTVMTKSDYNTTMTDIVGAASFDLPCKDGQVRHRHRMCAGQCPSDKVMEIKCESDVVDPSEAGRKAQARCVALCKLPASTQTPTSWGGFYVESDGDGKCSSFYSCNGGGVTVTYKDGKSEPMESTHVTFGCNSKTGAVEFVPNPCKGIECKPREVAKARCEAHKKP